MKHLLLTLLALTLSFSALANSILIEGFEYANHDLQVPVGWSSDDQSWLCGFQDKDHNRTAHTGNWYAFTNAEESWMYMPLYFSSELRYRFSLWAISDGDYTLELWLGESSNPADMSVCLHSTAITGGDYEEVFFDVNTIASDHTYLGIRAVASPGASHLTIDDVDIKMINRYDLDVTPYEFDTVMVPGSRITIEYEVKNMGFEDLDIYMTPHSDYFTDITFTYDGNNGRSFYTVPNQVVRCTCSATLLPSVTPGTRGWVDIMFTVSCDCITRMATLWANAIEPTEVGELDATVKVFPNPVTDVIHIDAQGLRKVEVWDLVGKKVISQAILHDELDLDLSALPSGMYFVTVATVSGNHTEKVVKL